MATFSAPTTVIVHIPEDESQARSIADALQQAGVFVWRSGNVLVGQSELEELSRRLVHGTNVVVCVSALALGKGLTRRVANVVTSRRNAGDSIRLLPVLLEDCDVEALGIAYGEHIKAADCRGDHFDIGVGELVESILAAGQSTVGDDIARYVRSLREEHAYLRLAGFVTRVRIPLRLSEVYVPLRARVHRPIMDADHRCFGAARELDAVAIEGPVNAESRPTSIDEQRDVPLDEALRLADRHNHRGLVVLGDPGSGKTTLLKHFVLACTDPDSGPATLGLHPDTVPVFVQLRALKDPAAGLDAALAAAVSQPTIGMEANFARKLLARDRLLVLVDGLDEVRTVAERAAVSRWLEAALSRLPESRFIVTSRYAGYRGDPRLDGRFLELHVRSLEEKESRKFIEAWYQAVETQASLDRARDVSMRIANEQATDLAESLFSPTDRRAERLQKLVENPLMLQIVCLVHRDRRRLPDRRVELYDECVRVLLGLWREAKGIPSTYAVPEALSLLQPLAYWMHTSGLEQAAEQEILPQLEIPLREMRRPLEEGPKFLDAIRDQSGVLVGLGQAQYAFLHLSFQEYLAARHVQGQALRKPKVVQRLARHFGDDRFREVLLLAVGLDNPSLFEPLMDALIAQNVLQKDALLADDCLKDAVNAPVRPFLRALHCGIEDASTRYHVLRLLRQLKGWQNAVLVVDDGAQIHAKDVVKRLADKDEDKQVSGLAGEMLDLIPGGTGSPLTQETRFNKGVPPSPARERGVRGVRSPAPGSQRVNPKDGSVLVYVPGGEFTLGADDLRDRERPVHRVRLSPFWIGKVPVTNAQFAEFLRHNLGHETPGYWNDKQFNASEQPVVGVSWDDAMAYAEWAGLTLPTEAQWEAAARGPDGRRYPWGNEQPTPEHANYAMNVGRTTPVGSYPKGAGRYGTLDQAGNVWEWCLDVWDDMAYTKRHRQGVPLNPVASVDTVNKSVDREPRVLRGGSWDLDPNDLAAAIRVRFRAGSRLGSLGFRCVLGVASPRVDSQQSRVSG